MHRVLLLGAASAVCLALVLAGSTSSLAAAIVFWTAVALVGNGRVDEALTHFARAFRMNPAWMLLIPRLVDVGQLPSTPGLADRILAAGPRPGAAPPR